MAKKKVNHQDNYRQIFIDHTGLVVNEYGEVVDISHLVKETEEMNKKVLENKNKNKAK